MNLTEFTLTRRFHAETPDGSPGFCYTDGQDLGITILPTGDFSLILHGGEYTSWDLAELELKLYRWAKEEGIIPRYVEEPATREQMQARLNRLEKQLLDNGVSQEEIDKALNRGT